MFWWVAEWCLVFLALIFISTQLIYPALTNKPWFWWVRKGGRELIKAEEELQHTQLEQEVQRVKRTQGRQIVEQEIAVAKEDLSQLEALQRAQAEIQRASDRLKRKGTK